MTASFDSPAYTYRCCVSKKKADFRSGLVSDDESSRRTERTEVVVVVGSSDGVVRVLRGPKRRFCGSFVSLAEGAVLSVIEMLGYRSSQVRANRVALKRALMRTTVNVRMRGMWVSRDPWPSGMGSRARRNLRTPNTTKQVLGHVNRTMAGLRARLRREWRLYPLTPGHLAKRTLLFLQCGR